MVCLDNYKPSRGQYTYYNQSIITTYQSIVVGWPFSVCKCVWDKHELRVAVNGEECMYCAGGVGGVDGNT